MPPEDLVNTIQLDIGEAAQDVLPYAGEVVAEGGGGQVVANIISSLLSVALVVGAIALLLFLVWGALEWITAGGDSGKIEKARTRITQSIVGILVLSSVIAIFMIVQNILGVSLINFSGRSGGSGSGGGSGSLNTNCPCGGGTGYANTGALGRLTYDDDATCYRCTSGGWQLEAGTTCGIIDCSWP
ncbi:unnamed protein product [marine sediment metagenome]|uniref:Uncharacterized protein n=1 Tax=marine sediment metagenome TaxID=412755 RepID=X0U4D2_9ZZZZ